MKLKYDEKKVLMALYVHERIPTDQYKRRPKELKQLTDWFNDLTDRTDNPEDLLHYMITQRKQGKWPTLGDRHKKLNPVELDILNADEWKILESIYLDKNIGSDNYAFDKDLRRALAKEFSKKTKRFVPARTLAAALENRRKQGFLPKLTPPPAMPFGDINEIAS